MQTFKVGDKVQVKYGYQGSWDGEGICLLYTSRTRYWEDYPGHRTLQLSAGNFSRSDYIPRVLETELAGRVEDLGCEKFKRGYSVRDEEHTA